MCQKEVVEQLDWFLKTSNITLVDPIPAYETITVLEWYGFSLWEKSNALQRGWKTTTFKSLYKKINKE